MKVNFNPISFKAAEPTQESNRVPQQTNSSINPLMEALKLDNEHVSQAKNPVELFNFRLHDDNWSKEYNFQTNTLHIKFPNSHDGTEYNVTSDGKVVSSDGWSSPKVILERHEELGKYVEAMKEFQLKNAVSYTSSKNKNDVNFGSTWDEFTNPINYNGTTPQTDGTITKTEAPTVKTPDIKTENVNEEVSATAVNEAQKDAENGATIPPVAKQKTTFKEKIANVWKFFTTFGQMTSAAFKGIVYGAVTAASLLAGSWMFNTLPKAFSKEGPKLLQVIKHPIKNIAKSGKVIAGIGAAAVFAYHLIAGKLSANQKTAVIDHKLHVGHRNN